MTAPLRSEETESASSDELTATQQRIEREFRAFVQRPDFPCLGAKSVIRVNTYRLRVYGALGTGGHSDALRTDLAEFGADFGDQGLSAFVAAFPFFAPRSEVAFERRLWAELQMLHDADPQRDQVAENTSGDPDDRSFSFSVGGRAFFVVGLHSLASRMARRFSHPVLVFNPHEQFTRLRAEGKFEGLRTAIRARDVALQGNVNPNLADFGTESEARQYSGRQTEPSWECPFHREHP